jgi:cytochrome bd ubiquinol oxidase subunit I
MDLTALLLSRIQFAFTIAFHIIFPSFTIGLAAWLTILEALHFGTGRPVYRSVFEFWLKVFAVAFGFGVARGTDHGMILAPSPALRGFGCGDEFSE